MSKTLIWILTKTMIPRAVAMAIAGAFVAWGLLSSEPIEREMYTDKGEKIIVKETPQNLVGEALTLLIVGGLSLFIENRKATEVKETQQLVDSLTPPNYEVKIDGLSGPKTRQAIKVAAEDVPPEPTETKLSTEPETPQQSL